MNRNQKLIVVAACSIIVIVAVVAGVFLTAPNPGFPWRTIGGPFSGTATDSMSLGSYHLPEGVICRVNGTPGSLMVWVDGPSWTWIGQLSQCQFTVPSNGEYAISLHGSGSFVFADITIQVKVS